MLVAERPPATAQACLSHRRRRRVAIDPPQTEFASLLLNGAKGTPEHGGHLAARRRRVVPVKQLKIVKPPFRHALTYFHTLTALADSRRKKECP